MVERQVPATADNDHSNQARSLAAAMGASLRRYWEERTAYQSFVRRWGAVVGQRPVPSAVFLLDGGGWNGPLSWRKPILLASRSGSRC